MVVLNADHMSLLEWADVRDSTPLRTRMAALPPVEVATTIISYEEQMRWWMAYIARTRSITYQAEAYRWLRDSWSTIVVTPVLTFDEQAAVTLQRLRRARISIGTIDLKIAAIALSHDAMLLSRNLADFRQLRLTGRRLDFMRVGVNLNQTTYGSRISGYSAQSEFIPNTKNLVAALRSASLSVRLPVVPCQ